MTELARQIGAVRSFRDANVVVVGDLILDEYVEGQARRLSPEAPVQVISVERTFFRLGGAANVAHLAAVMGARTSVSGCIGLDAAGATMQRLLDEAGIERSAVVEVAGRPTTRKLRALAQHQQLIRLDWEQCDQVDGGVVDAGVQACRSASPARGAIVVSDYGKGVVDAAAMKRFIGVARETCVPLLVDPKSPDFRTYAGATLLTPNLRELEQATGRQLSDVSDEEIVTVARDCIARCELDAMVVTLGYRGILVVPKDGASTRIATAAREVFDVTGAGDAVIAILALGLASALTLADASAVANAAAGIVVGKIGTAVVQPAELLFALAPHLAKVVTRDELLATVQSLRDARQRIVFTNGCFDLLHAGHLYLLREAAKHGDALIVGVNSDASIRRLKGAQRPIIAERDRADLVAALDCVSAAVVFDEDTPATLIEQIMPDVLVKGGDYTPDRVVGRQVVEAHGGRVELVALREGYSTTSLLERLRATESED